MLTPAPDSRPPETPPGRSPPVLLIHGPTTSGKTGLSVALAKQLGAEIVNADAMQVYRDLRVLTAQPTEAERQNVAHHLFGFVDPAERFSAGRWFDAVSVVLADMAARGKPAIVVGGTGLYLHVLAQGLADIPPIPEEVKAEAKSLLEGAGQAIVRERLRLADPESEARIQEGDRVRLLRAFEVWLATGRPMSAFQDSKASPLTPGRWLGVCLHPPRETLYGRIDHRFEAMIAGGALEEVRALSARKLPPDLPAMRAHGAPWLIAHVRGLMDLKDAIGLSKRDTRRYAKRQFTWIGRQFPHWVRIPAEATEQRLRVISSLLAEIDRA